MKLKRSEIFYNLFWIFIVGSVFGWIVEGIFTFIKRGFFINHSAVVIGPFDMAYGLGAIMLSVLLWKLKDAKITKIFLIGFLGGSILEYIMSFGMELVLGFTAWDYSNKFLNINGRICLVYSLFWGLLSIVWVKFIYPKLLKFVERFNNKIGRGFAWFLIIFLVLDVGLTISAVSRARRKEEGIKPQNKYEEVLDKTFNRDYLKNMYNDSWEN